MKKLLFTIALIFFLSLKMFAQLANPGDTTGQLVTAAIRPNSQSDDIATAYTNEIRGGLHNYQSLSDLQTIKPSRLVPWMLATIADQSGGLYQYNGSAWGPIELGGGSAPDSSWLLAQAADFKSNMIGGILVPENLINLSGSNLQITAGSVLSLGAGGVYNVANIYSSKFEINQQLRVKGSLRFDLLPNRQTIFASGTFGNTQFHYLREYAVGIFTAGNFDFAIWGDCLNYNVSSDITFSTSNVSTSECREFKVILLNNETEHFFSFPSSWLWRTDFPPVSIKPDVKALLIVENIGSTIIAKYEILN